jgi:formylglycine-generating enzyme required for sulfatase activity
MRRGVLLGLCLLVSLPCRGAEARSENLALTAQVSASSEYSPQYAARFACDGVIPQPLSRPDAGKAWCAKGKDHPNGVLFTLQWPQPVQVAEIVYYGRTGSDWHENWKDFEVYRDDDRQAVVKGTMKEGHGPQRIALPQPSAVKRITLKFLSAYDAPNPGASEIQVYSAPPPAELLGKFVAPPVVPGTPGQVDLPALRRAIEDLSRDFPRRYPKGPEFLKRLEELERRGRQRANADANAEAFSRDAAALQREALLANPLLDFDSLLLVRRRKHDGMFVNGSARWYPKTGFDDEILRLSPVRPDGRLTSVYRPAGPVLVGEMDLHWDADRMLLTTIGSKGCFHVFELDMATKALRQVTPAEHPDIDYYDPCYLPNGGILFTCTSNYQGTPCNRSGNTETLSLMAPGGKIRRLGFDQEFNWFPRVMNDGRVMYARWEYCDLPHTFSGMLFHMNPDGTGQRELYGSGAYWPNRIFYARPIPGQSGKFVGIVKGHHDEGSYGNLVVFDPGKGRKLTDGAVQRIPGYGKAVEPTYADWMNKVAPWAHFIHPYPLSDPSTGLGAGKYFLVSAQMPSTPDGTGYRGKFGIYLVDIFDNILPICTDPDTNLFEPIPVRKRPMPPVVPDQVDLSRTDAVVVLQDVYAGQGLAGVPRGTVKKLRLFTYHFSYRGTGGEWDRVGMDGPWEPKRVLGTVPVEADGSASFRVPANTPISVQPLDSEGKAIQLMRSWFTAMPGENVSCVGCHETQLTSPATAGAAAMARPPSEITPWYGPVRGFAFAREVQPVLDKYCVGCHAGQPGPQGKARPDLRDAPAVVRPSEFGPLTFAAKFTPSYRALVPLVRNVSLEPDRAVLTPCEYHADTTELVQMLRKGHHGVKLDAESWDRLSTWIDLNCPAHGTWHEAVVAVPTAEIFRLRDRRRELLRLFAVGREEDPEAIPPAPARKPDPIVPPPEPATGETVVCPNWPFDAAEATRRQQAGGTPERTLDLGGGVRLEMVWIPAGEFVMGDKDGACDERPAARVRVDRPFWMGRFEITNRQFQQFDPAHDSGLERLGFLHYSIERRGAPMNGPCQPVVRVSWQQAMDFCRWLSQKTGQRFTLPTEAQWEHACRAGTAGPFGCELTKPRVYTPEDRHTWAKPPTWTYYSHDAGQGPANAWGLHDMHGNVAEWTLSTYRPYPYRDDDGRNAATPESRKVVRGGSFADRPQRCGSAFRLDYPAWQKVFNVGVRVVALPEDRLAEAPKLDAALGHIPADARALVLVDARLHPLIAPDLSAYVQAASARRKFAIAVLPIAGLDDCPPAEIRAAIHSWHAERPKVEGILFVGNVKLPSFFMPRGDTLSARLWPRYYEDLDMAATREMQPGSTLSFAPKGFKVPEHDFDQMAHPASGGPAIWTAFLPVGYQDDARNTYENWAKQLAPFFRKTAAFYGGATSYGRGLYLVSNDMSLLQRAKPVWEAVGPKQIEFYAINEKGKDAFKNNPAGYVRVPLDQYPSLEAFAEYARRLPWMDEGWQSADTFLGHMKASQRRFVWWNVHSTRNSRSSPPGRRRP